MIILSDVDGVFADLVEGLCVELRASGFDRTPEHFKHYDLAECLTAEEMRVVLTAMAAPGFCHAIEWYPGAREFLRELVKLGEVHAVTAPFDGSSTWASERRAWLSSEMPRKRVHAISGEYKHMLRGDVLLEDHPANACAWLDAHPTGLALLVDRPWNSPAAKEFWPHARMVRVRSFDEALDRLKECA